jgi:hypothetical protein
MGARRFATASSPRASAIARAVLPVTHPPQVNPTIMVRMPIPSHDQNTTVFVGRDAAHLSLNVGGRFDWSIVVLLGAE